MDNPRSLSIPFYADMRTALMTIIAEKATSHAGSASLNGLYYFDLPPSNPEVGPGNCFCDTPNEPYRHDFRSCPRREAHPLWSLSDPSVLLLKPCRHEPRGRQHLPTHGRKNCFDPTDEINRFMYWFLAFRAGLSGLRIEADDERSVHRAVTNYLAAGAERGSRMAADAAIYPQHDYIKVLRMLVWQFVYPKQMQTGHPVWKPLWKTHVVLGWEGKTYDEILDELIPAMIAARRARGGRTTRNVGFAGAS